MMQTAPFGGIALATVFGIDKVCQEDEKLCKEVEESMDAILDGLDVIDTILFGNETQEEYKKRVKKLYKLQKKVVKNELAEYVQFLKRYDIEADAKFLSLSVVKPTLLKKGNIKSETDVFAKELIAEIKEEATKLQQQIEILNTFEDKEQLVRNTKALTLLHKSAEALYEAVTTNVDNINGLILH